MGVSLGGRGSASRCAAALLVALLTAMPVRSQDGGYSADAVKAAFLYHFGTYVQWPRARASGAPLAIAVLGAEAVAAELERIVPGRTIQGRRVQVLRIDDIDSLADAEVLYIGADHNARLATLLERVGDRPVLTVSDAPDGLEHGAMVNFQLVGERVRFEVSLAAAQRAGLVLSSRLLAAALRVEMSRCRADCRIRGPGSLEVAAVAVPAPRVV